MLWGLLPNEGTLEVGGPLPFCLLPLAATDPLQFWAQGHGPRGCCKGSLEPCPRLWGGGCTDLLKEGVRCSCGPGEAPSPAAASTAHVAVRRGPGGRESGEGGRGLFAHQSSALRAAPRKPQEHAADDDSEAVSGAGRGYYLS